MRNKRLLAISAIAISASVFMTACSFGGDGKTDKTETVEVTDTPTPEVTQAPTETPVPTIAPNVQSTTYTSADKSIAINLPDATWANKTDETDMLSFEEDEVIIQNPHDSDLIEFSQKVYDVMDTAFEEAPICDEPSSHIWVMGLDLLEMPLVPLPEITPGMTLKKDVENCLSYSKGEPLLYFTTYDELRRFFVEELKWEDKNESLLPELRDERNFVIYANAKGMLIASNVSYCFCDPRNPTYNAEKAAAKGYKLFTYPGTCPFDLLKYGMAKGLLPDMQLPFPGGKEVLHDNWDFIARYFLCEYYEGE